MVMSLLFEEMQLSPKIDHYFANEVDIRNQRPRLHKTTLIFRSKSEEGFVNQYQIYCFLCFYLFLFNLALLCRRHAVFRTVSFVPVIEALKTTDIFTESPKSQQFYALVGYLPSAVQKRLLFLRYILNYFISVLCCLLSSHS